jgi:hypothetical protein
MGEMRKSYKIVFGKPAGNRAFRRFRQRMEDNIKLGLGKPGWQGVDWIHLTQDTDQWLGHGITVMNVQVS